jgi:peptide/nickel transport system substrate-binding protein
MLMLGEQNPVTMEYDPLLITEMPEAILIEGGENAGKYEYNFEILPDASWSDGSPVTAEDYLFTVKLIYHKGLNLVGYKTIYKQIIESISVDQEDPKKFTVITPNPDKDNLIFLCGVEVYPKQYYDPNDVLSKYSIEDLLDESNYENQINSDPALAEFASQFQEAKYSREVVEGAGPYKLSAWEADQFVRLERKENYWGDNYPDRIPLQAYPEEIIFQIVRDDVVAINQLSAGELDVAVLQSTTGERFLELKEEEVIASQFDFYTPKLSRYIYLQLNNESPFLSDKKVRKALAHLIDVDRIIEVVEGGVGTRVTSVISDSRPYYNNTLLPIPYDLEEAKRLLTEAGWTDTNGNGTVDKVINGDLTEMQMRLHTSSSSLSQRVSLTMKEGAAQVGIGIDHIKQSFRVTRPQNLETGDFEITPMMSTSSPIDNLYQQWHSSQIGGKGQNYARFSNTEADQIFEELNQERDEEKRKELFKKAQQIIYDEYARLMLYAPVEKILVSKKFDPLITSRKPGYIANAFKPVE